MKYMMTALVIIVIVVFAFVDYCLIRSAALTDEVFDKFPPLDEKEVNVFEENI